MKSYVLKVTEDELRNLSLGLSVAAQTLRQADEPLSFERISALNRKLAREAKEQKEEEAKKE